MSSLCLAETLHLHPPSPSSSPFSFVFIFIRLFAGGWYLITATDSPISAPFSETHNAPLLRTRRRATCKRNRTSSLVSPLLSILLFSRLPRRRLSLHLQSRHLVLSLAQVNTKFSLGFTLRVFQLEFSFWFIRKMRVFREKSFDFYLIQ